MKQITKKEIVWDWSIRVFHWLFAASVSMALVIGLTVDDDSPLFEWHMLAGLTAGFLLLLRLVLFVVGSRPINWRGLLEAVRGIPAFVGDFFSKKENAEAGHNPMAWAVYLLMFGLLAGSVLTGVNMHIDWAEDVHEIFAWALLAMIVAHLLGLVLHTLRFRENIALSMVTGRKRVRAGSGLKSPRPIFGLALLAVSLAFMAQLVKNYQTGSGQIKLPWVQMTVALGEDEANEAKHDEHGDRNAYKDDESDEHDD